jgi:hypothetical protein
MNETSPKPKPKPRKPRPDSDPYLISARLLRESIVGLRKEVKELTSLLKQVAKTSHLPTDGLTKIAAELDND